MNSDLVFLCGCIPARLFLVVLMSQISQRFLRYSGFVALLPAIGFISLFMFDLRKVAIETNGKPVWWNSMRPIHGLLYLGFALYAIKCHKFAYIFLMLDLVFAIILFVFYKKR